MTALSAVENVAVSAAASSDDELSSSQTGLLVALRTKAEVVASFTTIDVFITEIPQKSASKALKCVNKASH